MPRVASEGQECVPRKASRAPAPGSSRSLSGSPEFGKGQATFMIDSILDTNADAGTIGRIARAMHGRGGFTRALSLILGSESFLDQVRLANEPPKAPPPAETPSLPSVTAVVDAAPGSPLTNTTAPQDTYQVLPLTYSMVNGSGTVEGASILDDTYTGPNSLDARNQTGASLSGGVGKLTDGIDGLTDPRNDNGGDTWVGWYNTTPQITFDFGTAVDLSQFSVFADNFGVVPGFSAPNNLYQSVRLETSSDGQNWTLVTNYATTPTEQSESSVAQNYSYDVAPGSADQQYVRLTFDPYAPNDLILISEIQFFAATPALTPSGFPPVSYSPTRNNGGTDSYSVAGSCLRPRQQLQRRREHSRRRLRAALWRAGQADRRRHWPGRLDDQRRDG